MAEAYPDLKANQNFLMLQEELAGTEGKIAYARQFYNDTGHEVQPETAGLPSNVIARHVRLQGAGNISTSTEPAAKEPVKVQF